MSYIITVACRAPAAASIRAILMQGLTDAADFQCTDMEIENFEDTGRVELTATNDLTQDQGSRSRIHRRQNQQRTRRVPRCLENASAERLGDLQIESQRSSEFWNEI